MESLEIYQDEIDNALDKYRGDKKPEEPKMQTKQPTNKSKRNPKKKNNMLELSTTLLNIVYEL